MEPVSLSSTFSTKSNLAERIEMERADRGPFLHFCVNAAEFEGNWCTNLKLKHIGNYKLKEAKLPMWFFNLGQMCGQACV